MGLTERSFLERMELMGFTPSIANTNGNMFRAMSDEELAEWFDRHASEPLWCVLPKCPDHKECVKCILTWLKSPAEKGE